MLRADEQSVDVLVVGTGLVQSIAAAALAHAGKRVLHVDRASFYGERLASHDLAGLLRETARCSECEGDDAVPDALASLARRFSVDATAQVVHAGSQLVDVMIRGNVGRYVDFMLVNELRVLQRGRALRVPSARSDVFGSNELGLREKRALMRLVTTCQALAGADAGAGASDSGAPGSDGAAAFSGAAGAGAHGPFERVLTEHALPPFVADAFRHLLVGELGVREAREIDARVAAERVQVFMRGFGRFGRSTLLYPLYGVGELVQAFCRVCAVWGGTYMLRCDVHSVAAQSAADAADVASAAPPADDAAQQEQADGSRASSTRALRARVSEALTSRAGDGDVVEPQDVHCDFVVCSQQAAALIDGVRTSAERQAAEPVRRMAHGVLVCASGIFRRAAPGEAGAEADIASDAPADDEPAGASATSVGVLLVPASESGLVNPFAMLQVDERVACAPAGFEVVHVAGVLESSETLAMLQSAVLRCAASLECTPLFQRFWCDAELEWPPASRWSERCGGRAFVCPDTAPLFGVDASVSCAAALVEQMYPGLPFFAPRADGGDVDADAVAAGDNGAAASDAAGGDAGVTPGAAEPAEHVPVPAGDGGGSGDSGDSGAVAGEPHAETRDSPR